MAGGVQGLVGGWQGSGPQAYSSQGVLPDPRTLGEWMQQQLDTSGGLLMFRRSRDPYDRAVAYLLGEGVDVDRALTETAHRHEGDMHRARAGANAAVSLAIDLKKARRRLLHEARGVNEGAQGFTRGTLAAAEDRAARLAAALDEACSHDRALVRAARRAVA